MFKDNFDFLSNLYSQNRLTVNIWQPPPRISLYSLIENLMSINLIFVELSMVQQKIILYLSVKVMWTFSHALSPLFGDLNFSPSCAV